mgnify:CR=1 FL=1
MRHLVIGLTAASLQAPAWASDAPQPASPRDPLVASAPRLSVTQGDGVKRIDIVPDAAVRPGMDPDDDPEENS